MLLYIHVPFCRKKCLYCSFFSKPLDPLDLSPYLATLRREIRKRSRQIGDREITSMYFGGGTPSLLPLDELDKLVTSLRQSFSLAPDLEFTFEANPESLDREYLKRLKSLGCNRISLGIQSLDDDILSRLGRIHTARQALDAFHLARRLGFSFINVDLIWGLPGHSTSQWLEQLEHVVALGPEHISAYGLTVEPGTPLQSLVDTGTVDLPDEDAQAEMFLLGSGLLVQAGYLHYEISNFARQGRQSRHNQGYWQGKEYLGLGPSAVSTIDGVRFQNPPSLSGYQRAVDTGKDVVCEPLDPQTRLREKIMLGLRTCSGLDLSLLDPDMMNQLSDDFESSIARLTEEGLMIRKNHIIRLTPRGWLVSDVIMASLFP